MTAGIYQILNRITEDKYIGGSRNADLMLVSAKRILSSLERPVQAGKAFRLESKLSEDWFDYGEENFTLSIIEKTPRFKSVIGSRLNFWCRLLQPTYNCCRYTPIVSGIYQIYNIKNNFSYIGQSKDIYTRWIQHKNQLRTKTHFNSKLQQSFDKYGESSFELKILQVCVADEKAMLNLERIWIKQTSNTFNTKNQPNL